MPRFEGFFENLVRGGDAAGELLLVHADAAALLALDPVLPPAMLPDAELLHLDSFTLPTPARLFAASRVLLRGLLGALLARDPASLSFEKNAWGKPALSGYGAPHFNVAHSGGQVIVAIDRMHAVGVDIEPRKRKVDWRGLASMVCNAAEISALEHADSTDEFMRIWTQKEAVAKVLGMGLSAPLREITATPAGENRWRRVGLPRGLPHSEVSVIELILSPGFCGHLASAGGEPRFRLQRAA
jgi:4'-phosphopantetheinyl transferase